MDLAANLIGLVVRDEGPAPVACDTGNEYDGRMGARISSIFVILVGSTLGAVFPIFARSRLTHPLMEYGFFFAKYFGSGVIIATAFIHLLAPATEALGNPCLTGQITEYPWAMGICLIMVFILFFLELMTVRYASFGHSHDHDDEHTHGHSLKKHSKQPKERSHRGSIHGEEAAKATTTADENKAEDDVIKLHSGPPIGGCAQAQTSYCADTQPTHLRGEDHLGHGREHQSNEDLHADWQRHDEHPESYVSQMTAIFILEFGVVFHSIFIGLTLAVAGQEFVSLYIVLVFHQTFEGLGLGTRLASAPWPKSKRWTPYILALAYGLSTPLAIAIGLAVRGSYPPGSATTLIVNGIFDSLSAGILIYTGLVELMAHEFMFSPRMRKAPLKTVLAAFAQMCLGAGLMALLGKWA